MIKKNKYRWIIAICILLFVILLRYLINVAIINDIQKEEQNHRITLYQLSAQSGTQMMGYIIKTKNDKIIAIDGGYSTDVDNFMKYINEFGGRVDYWFLTHPHEDHASVLVDVIKNKKVEIGTIVASLNDSDWYTKNDFYRSDMPKELIKLLNKEDTAEEVISPNINDVYEIDGIKAEILGIKNPEIEKNKGNEQSMVIKLDTGKTTLLFLGDTGEKSSEKLLLNQKDKLKSDYVQMAHHGQAGATKELYQAVNPNACLWPTPQWLWNNDNGEGYNTGPWKTLETRAWMEELDVKENYVAKDGDISIEIK